jgi:lipopolysaccharide export system protein LptA
VQARRSGGASDSSWSPLGDEGEFWVSARAFEVDPETWSWRFEEQVRAWQGSNLIETDRLDVDEGKHTLQALGNVVTRGVSSTDTEGSGTDLVWVRAPRLRYAEDGRLAEYRGGVELIHDTSHLSAEELDVHLSERGSSIERVLARGEVQTIYQDALGEAERAEYQPVRRHLRLWTPGGSARARRRDGSEALSGQELTFEGASGRISVKSGTRGRSWIVLEDAP